MRRHVFLAGALSAMALASLIAAAAQATTWTWLPPLTTLDGNAITAIACPSMRLCVAADAHGNTLTSTRPTGGSRAWTLRPVAQVPGGEGLVGVACPSASLCVAAGGLGDVFVTHNAGDGSGARWTRSLIDAPHPLTSISCPMSSLCVASDSDQSVLTTTNPTAGGSWTRSVIATETYDECSKYEMGFCPVALSNVSCPSARMCVAVDGQGYVLWSTDPAGGADAWSSADVDVASDFGQSTPVSCPSSSFCAFAGNGGLFRSTAPASGPGAWTSQPLGISAFTLTCPLTTLCLANDGAAPNLISQNPASATARWYRSNADRGAAITSLACPSSALCVAGDDRGAVTVGTTERRPLSRHRPAITGTTAVGHRLTASPGVWSGTSPIHYAYQWQRCSRRCVDIARATRRFLRLAAAERGRRIRVIVTASNLAGAARHFSPQTRRVA